MEVRVRYAPSPTGLQHIGGIRTALFNYFFAKASGGKFILRIEDTDQERYFDEALEDLYETLRWLGISWDEGPDSDEPCGPYVQSKRFAVYQKYAAELTASGHAYPCFCTPERLDKLREEQKNNKDSQQGYDRHCRQLAPDETEQRIKNGEKYVLRFKIPLEGTTEFEDIIMGKISRENKDINPDPVLIKSDGFPTYHLANIIDDHLMKITHILRAQEWLSSGPLHVLLYKAFGWEPPKYCHLPMVMGSDGHKLSKRHGATSVRQFREAGYLPEAVINYVSLLGWSYDDKKEMFSKAELEKLFNIEKLNTAPAVFDYKKLEWFNGLYIRALDDSELSDRILPFLIKEKLVEYVPTEDEQLKLRKAVVLVKERLVLLSQAPAMLKYIFMEPDDYSIEDLLPKKTGPEETAAFLELALSLFADIDKYSDQEMEELLKARAAEYGTGLGNILMPVRVALTGSKVSPPILGSIRVIGTQTALKRIQRAIDLLRNGVEK